METIKIIGFIIAGFNVIVLPWSIWVTKQLYDLQTKAALNSQQDKDTISKIGSLEHKLDEILAIVHKLEIEWAENKHKRL